MKNKLLRVIVAQFIKRMHREPTEKEMEDLNESAYLLARDINRIARLEANEYIQKIQKDTK
jgi:hypothetical protein